MMNDQDAAPGLTPTPTEGGAAAEGNDAGTGAATHMLENRLEACEEALAFYANPETYFAIGIFPDPPCGEFIEDIEELTGTLGHPDGGAWSKPGKRARAYFAEYHEGYRAALAETCPNCGKPIEVRIVRGHFCPGKSQFLVLDRGSRNILSEFETKEEAEEFRSEILRVNPEMDEKEIEVLP